MRLSVFATFVLILLTLASGGVAKAQNSAYWRVNSFGGITFQKLPPGAVARYPGGIIIGSFSGKVLKGIWVEAKSQKKCPGTKPYLNGKQSHFWGEVYLEVGRYQENQLIGTWNYCGWKEFSYHLKGRASPGKTPVRQAALSAACKGAIQGYLDDYRGQGERLRRAATALNGLRGIPKMPDLPDIKVCLNGRLGMIEYVSTAREVSEWAKWLNSIASLAANPSGMLSAAITSSEYLSNHIAASKSGDRTMSAEEAIAFFQNYSRLRERLSRAEAIRIQSCADRKLSQKVRRAQATWENTFQTIRSVAGSSQCSDGDRAALQLPALQGRHQSQKERINSSLNRYHGYTPDYSRCPGG